MAWQRQVYKSFPFLSSNVAPKEQIESETEMAKARYKKETVAMDVILAKIDKKKAKEEELKEALRIQDSINDYEKTIANCTESVAGLKREAGYRSQDSIESLMQQVAQISKLQTMVAQVDAGAGSMKQKEKEARPSRILKAFGGN